MSKKNKKKKVEDFELKNLSPIMTPPATPSVMTPITPPLPNPGRLETVLETPKEKTDVQQLIDTVKSQAEDIKMLLSVADKKSLSNYFQRNQGKIPLHVKLRVLNEKVVVGWRTLVDISEFDVVLRRFKEVQTLEVVFEDATKAEMSLVDFNRQFTYVECEQIGTIEESDALILKLKRLDNGIIYQVDVRFVN